MTGMQPLAHAAAVPAAALAQAATEIVWTEVVTAVALAIIALVAVGAAYQGILLLHSLRGVMRSFDRVISRLAPGTERLVHHAERVAEDAGEITAMARAHAKRLNGAVESLDDRMRNAVDAAEVRVRRLGHVLELVQTEMEDTLLDAAAAARGIQAVAERLQHGSAAADGVRRRSSSDRADAGAGRARERRRADGGRDDGTTERRAGEVDEEAGARPRSTGEEADR